MQALSIHTDPYQAVLSDTKTRTNVVKERTGGIWGWALWPARPPGPATPCRGWVIFVCIPFRMHNVCMKCNNWVTEERMKINSLVTFRLIHKVELRSILHRIVNLWVKKSDQVHSFLPTKLFSNGFEVSGSMNSGACLNQSGAWKTITQVSLALTPVSL